MNHQQQDKCTLELRNVCNYFQELSSQERFDEDYYCCIYKDVATAVSKGEFLKPLDHWIRHGKNERRVINREERLASDIVLHIESVRSKKILIEYELISILNNFYMRNNRPEK